MKSIILASQSPRRKELLNLIDLDFKVETKSINEVFPNHLKTAEVAGYLAELKSSAFTNIEEEQIVITADTVVVLDKCILGKNAYYEKCIIG